MIIYDIYIYDTSYTPELTLPTPALVNANQPFKCKVVRSLAVNATWTNQLIK